MQGFPCGSAGKESACSAGNLGLIPGLGRSPGEGKGYPLQYSGLENSMDYIVHGVIKSQTRLSNCHFHHFKWVNSIVCELCLNRGLPKNKQKQCTDQAKNYRLTFHILAYVCLNNIMANAIVMLHRIHFNGQRNVGIFYQQK